MGQDFLAPPKRRYVCVFETPRPGYTFKVPEIEFEAVGDDEAYRYVIDEILGKGEGFKAVASLVLTRVAGSNGTDTRVPLMRWRPGPGWDFVDGRQGSLYEAPPKHSPWYGEKGRES